MLVFLLMGILFESVLLPISVLTTIPFAVLGALWTLYLTGTVMDSVGCRQRVRISGRGNGRPTACQSLPLRSINGSTS